MDMDCILHMSRFWAGARVVGIVPHNRNGCKNCLQPISHLSAAALMADMPNLVICSHQHPFVMEENKLEHTDAHSLYLLDGIILDNIQSIEMEVCSSQQYPLPLQRLVRVQTASVLPAGSACSTAALQHGHQEQKLIQRNRLLVCVLMGIGHLHNEYPHPASMMN